LIERNDSLDGKKQKNRLKAVKKAEVIWKRNVWTLEDKFIGREGTKLIDKKKSRKERIRQ
jgi:hypothetical protein